MVQAKVAGTRIRGGRYFFNLAVPVVLRGQYDGKERLTDAIGTADARTAADAVTTAKARFIEQKKATNTNAEQNALVEALPSEQRALYDAAGGLEGLLGHYEASKVALAFMAGDTPPDDATDDLEEMFLDGEYTSREKVLTNLARDEAKTLNALGKNVDVPGGVFETLNDVAAKFLETMDYPKQTAESYRYTFRRWKEYYGDLKVDDITREMLSEFEEALKGLPLTTAKDVRSLPMRKAIKVASRDKLALSGFSMRSRIVAHLKQVLSWGLNKGYVKLTHDPWIGYKLDKPRLKNAAKKLNKRKAFLPSEVRRILEFVAKSYDKDLIDFWLPYFAAYTGARLEELAQLRVDDVVTLQNTLCISITDLDSEQRTKNVHSVRVVPVPEPILELGFADFAERRRKANGKILFMVDFSDNKRRVRRIEIPQDSRDRRGAEYGRRVSRKVLIPLGLKKAGQATHAFRHAWTDAAKNASIDREIRRAIAGRLEGDDIVEVGYSEDHLIPLKVKALKQMEPFVLSNDGK